MKKSDAISQLSALHIPYMDDGQSLEATKRSLREPEFASYVKSRDMITVHCEDAGKLEALGTQGWEINRPLRSAMARDFEPEGAPEPNTGQAVQRASFPVVVTSGIGFTGVPSDTLVDVAATTAQFRALVGQPLVAGGGMEHARHTLIQALREHVEHACPGASRGQHETQIRLLVHAVVARCLAGTHGYTFRGYQGGEAYQ